MGFCERLVGRWGSGITASVVCNVVLTWRLVQLHYTAVLPPDKEPRIGYKSEAVWTTGSLSLCDFEKEKHSVPVCRKVRHLIQSIFHVN